MHARVYPTHKRARLSIPFRAGWVGPHHDYCRLPNVGPPSEHRGSAIRLYMVTEDGEEVADEAEVCLETSYKTGEEHTVIFQGTYGQFKAIPDQYADNAAVAVQRRVEAGEDYVIRLILTVLDGGSWPDSTADDSFFEVECVKLWWNETA